MSKSALLICGGGLKGIFDLPIVGTFEPEDFDYVCGVSWGAILGACFCCGKMDVLMQIVMNLNGRGPLTGIPGLMAPVMWKNRGLYSLKPLHRKLKKHIDAKSLRTTFQAGVVSRENNDYHQPSFDASASTQRLHRAVLASSAMAGIHEPWTLEIRGESHLCSDGGHINVLPKIPFDVTSVVAIFHRPLSLPDNNRCEVNGLFEAIDWAIDMQMNEHAMAGYERLKHWAKHPQNSARIYAPKKSLGKPFDCKRKTVKERMEAGEEALENPTEL